MLLKAHLNGSESPKTPLKFRKKDTASPERMMLFNYQNLLPLNKKPGTGRPQPQGTGPPPGTVRATK